MTEKKIKQKRDNIKEDEIKSFISKPLSTTVLSPEKAEEIFSKFKIIKIIQPRKKNK